MTPVEMIAEIGKWSFAVIALVVAFALLLRWFRPTKDQLREKQSRSASKKSSSVLDSIKDYWGKRETTAVITIAIALTLANVVMSQFGWGAWQLLWEDKVLFCFFWATALLALLAIAYPRERPDFKFVGYIGKVLLVMLLIGWMSMALGALSEKRKEEHKTEQVQKQAEELAEQAVIKEWFGPIKLKLNANEWSEVVHRRPWFPKIRFVSPVHPRDYEIWVNDEPTPRKSVNGDVLIRGVFLEKLRIRLPEAGTFVIYDSSEEK